jgi:Domain of unknown function (DUF4159)
MLLDRGRPRSSVALLSVFLALFAAAGLAQRFGFRIRHAPGPRLEFPAFRETMDRVFPGKPITDIAESDSVMHVVYDIREKDLTWIPGTRHLRRGPGGTIVVQQPPGTAPAWRAVYDDRNHMVVAVNYNTDVGDAWEWADAPEYPEAMTTLAYHYGINYLVYAMTH